MLKQIKNKIKRVNETIATRVTLAMSTMWCVYSFALLVILPLIWPSTSSFVQYLSSAMIQLIALPMIMVGQKLLDKGAERRAKQDHQMLLQILQRLEKQEQNKTFHDNPRHNADKKKPQT